MQMWRVQTALQSEESGLPWGLVSTGAGFEDSPDAEVISGGVNTKGVDSVAVGRHGNFLLWGFAVSPEHMTDEARLTFVNAVHYISRFDGQRPFVTSDGYRFRRTYLKDIVHQLSPEGVAGAQEVARKANEKIEQEKARIAAKQRAGESLSERDERYLNIEPLPIPQRGDNLWGVPADMLQAFAGDWHGLAQHIESISPFVYPDDGYSFIVDEDVRSIGIANNDVALLERCVSDLESGTEVERAQRVLERYTNESFESAAEWRQWLDANVDRLFFTEFGGYKFLIDPSNEPVDDQLIYAEPRRPEIQVGMTSPRSPINFAAALVPSQRSPGRWALVVKARIHNGWHIYATVPPGHGYIPTTIDVTLPEGVSLAGNWQRPAGRMSPEAPSLLMYAGQPLFAHELELAVDVAPPASIEVTVNYQVCDANRCLPPATITLQAVMLE